MKLLQNVLATCGLKLALAIALMLSISACAQRPLPPPLDLRAVRSIGTNSSCANSIMRVRAPALSFGSSDLSSQDIKDWRLDDRILDAVDNSIQGSIDFNRIELSERQIAIAQIDRYASWGDAGAWNRVFENAPRNDLYLAFIPSVGGVGNYMGFGIYSRMGLGHAFYSCTAILYDPKLRKVVRRYGLYSRENVSRDLREKSWSDYSDEQMLKVQNLMANGADTLAMQFTTEFKNDLFKKGQNK